MNMNTHIMNGYPYDFDVIRDHDAQNAQESVRTEIIHFLHFLTCDTCNERLRLVTQGQ